MAETPNARIRIRIELTNPDDVLRPPLNMYADVEISTGVRRLLVPDRVNSAVSTACERATERKIVLTDQRPRDAFRTARSQDRSAVRWLGRDKEGLVKRTRSLSRKLPDRWPKHSSADSMAGYRGGNRNLIARLIDWSAQT